MIFKCRASQSIKLLTDPKKPTDLLSQTTKSYLDEWLKGWVYGVKKEISNKYLTKGNECEDEAIEKAIEWLDLPFCMKNETHFQDDYFQGTPDLIVDGRIYDIKNSWDCFTFPLFENEIPTKDYISQVNVYMEMTGLKHASVVYVLCDTPETYNTPAISYSHIDKKYRIKKYDFEYDPALIAKLQSRVLLSRDYINKSLNQIK